MKKVLLLLAVALPLLFVGCSENKEKRAKELITHQLKVTLHDFDSYESVEFGKLDTVFTTLLNDSLFKKYFAKRLACQKLRNGFYDESQLYRLIDKEKYNEFNAKCLLYNDSTGYYLNKEDSIKKHFKPKFDGWSMAHSFRAKNASGNKMISHEVYSFDKDITKITESEDYQSFHNFNLDEELKNMEKDFLGLKE